MIKKMFLMVLCITSGLLAGPFGDEELQRNRPLTAAERNALNNLKNKIQAFNNEEQKDLNCCDCVIATAGLLAGAAAVIWYKVIEHEKSE